MNPSEIKKQITDRLNHPFLGTFTIAFIVHNWRAWLYVFTGNLASQERIDQISTLFHNDNPGFILKPLVYAVLFTILYPLLTGLINYCYLWVQLEEDNRKTKLTERIDAMSPKLVTAAAKIARDCDTQLSSLTNYISNQMGSSAYNVTNQIQPIKASLQALAGIETNTQKVITLARHLT
jgi:hypothetical protein